MSFFERIFNFNTAIDDNQPNIPFGRYTDVYKTTDQYNAWDKAMAHFEKEEYMDSYRQFFVYLSDLKEKNVKWHEESGTLHFELQQGSGVIKGFINAEKIKAESIIAIADVTNVGFMRRLMEHNFSLKYCRFALTAQNHIAILFDTFLSDGSPLKLYSALKELSINADKQDDLLLDEFKMLQPSTPIELDAIPDAEKEVKYNYIQQEIKAVFEEYDNGKPDTNQYPGGYAYSFLYLSYKLDYLIRPEGFMMETLEKVHRIYFSAAEEKNTQLKNIAIRKELQKLLDRPKEEFYKEFYRTTSTFGITTPVNHERLAALIDGELKNIIWYKDNNHTMLALGIPGYIASYALFNYAMPKPDKDFLHFYIQIMEAPYFKALGFNYPFREANGSLNKKAILKRIKEIVTQNKANYAKLVPNIDALDFTTPVTFAKSYLEMIKDFNLQKTE
jgi:hypothetical protein